MSDEPNLPPLPSIGDVLNRKNLKEFKTTVLKCTKCRNKSERSFKEGDFIFKKFKSPDKTCECSNNEFIIIEIFAEFKKVKRSV